MSVSVQPPVEPARESAALPAESALYRWIFPLLGVLSLLASCVLWSLKKQQWADEVFTRVELGDPSFAHLLRSVPHLGGAGMPLFYLTGWPWAHIFGLSDLSLRLYSSAGVCAAFLVIFLALRRRLGARPAFLGAAFGFFAHLMVLSQNAEARDYGLYLFLTALAVSELLRIAEIPQPRARDLLRFGLSQAGMVLGHVLALIFAFPLLLALVVADLSLQRRRWKVWLSGVAGWAALLPWIPAIRASMAVGKPHGWIALPHLTDLFLSFSGWLFAALYVPFGHGHPLVLLTGWAAALLCIVAIAITGIHGLRTEPHLRALYLAGFVLLLSPIAIFTVSWIVAPIWVGRYMLPTAIGIAILAAAWARYATQRLRGSLAAAVAVLLLLLPPASALAAHPQFVNVTRIDRVLSTPAAAGRPLVCDSIRDFLVVERYSTHPASIEFPLDWQAALHGPPIAVGGYHLMVNYRRAGYLAPNIVDGSALLRRHSFLVLDNSATNWFRLVIQSNPRFTWRVLAQVDPTRRILLVTARP